MRRNVLKSILYILLTISFSACDKEPVEREKEVVRTIDTGIKINIDQNIADLDNTDIKEISTVDTIVFNDVKFPVYEVEIEGAVDEVKSIVPGSIVFIPSGEEGGKLIFVSEIGDLKKSSSLFKGTGTTIIKGVQATLDMYYNGKHAVEEFSTPANRAKENSKLENKLQSPEKLPLGDMDISFKVKKEGISFSSSPDKLCQLDMKSTLWKSGTSSIEVSGSLDIQPAIDFFMEYEPIEITNGSGKGASVLEFLEAALVPDLLIAQYRDQNYYLGNMKELRCNIYTDIDREMKFNINLSKGFSSNIRIPIGSFVIPTVPVSANMELAFEIDFEALGEIDMEIFSKKEDDVVLSVVLDRDLTEPVWEIEYNQRTESGFKLQAKLDLTTGIHLVMSTEVYLLGVLGPEINVGAFVEATASVHAVAGFGDQPAVNWKLSAEAGIMGSATLNLAAFHIDKATWKMYAMVKREISKNIYRAPDYLGVISGNEQVGNPGTVLSNPIRVGAYDSRDNLITYLPVPVYFEAENGTASPSKDLTSDGIAETTWTLGEQNSNQTLFAYFKDGSAKKGEIELNAGVEGNTPLTADFRADITNLVKGGTVKFTDLSTGGPTSWTWDFGDEGTSTETDPSHTYSSAGTYTVKLEVSNSNGSDSEIKTGYITVSESGGMNETGTMTDSRDGNIYKTVKIDDQWWMAENLAYLPQVMPSSTGSNTTACYYVYDYQGTNLDEAISSEYYSEYGVLYNWAAAQEVCPSGWHLPSKTEWSELVNYLSDNGYNYDGSTGGNGSKLAKAWALDYDWSFSSVTGAPGNTDYPEKRNLSGFSVLPHGTRNYEGEFDEINTLAAFWSSTKFGIGAHYRAIYFNRIEVREGDGAKISRGHGVRCVKD